MPENSVTFEPPDFDNPQELDAVLYALTNGAYNLASFVKEVGDNCFGRYDDLYKEETNAAK